MTAENPKPRGRPPRDVTLRPAKLVPMTPEQRQRAVEALAALLLARWAKEGRPREAEQRDEQ